MTNTQNEIDIISHAIEFMSNKTTISELFEKHTLVIKKSDSSYSKLAKVFRNAPDSFSVSELTELFRSKWSPCNIERHISHLKSGLLSGHDWHGAMPSILHRSIQDKVRDCCDGHISLKEYLEIGGDIFKHEYFMVATHDICESSVILSDETIIPPIGSKSVTDFIYAGIPYDLKVSSHPSTWQSRAGNMSVDEKKQLAVELYKGADSERMRKVAEICRHNWGLNRMYYLVADQDKWLHSPEETVNYLISRLSDADNYFDIVVHGLQIHICLIEQ